MLLPKFEFHEPTSIQEAIELKKKHGKKAKFLAGGTDLLVHLKKKLVTADHIISLSEIEALSQIKEEGDAVTIGACATMAQLSKSKIIQEKFCAVKAGADNLGTHLIRNRATIGGNVCNASPAGDTICSLIVYQAQVVLQGPEGQRKMAIESFFKGPGKTDIKDDEILVGFQLPLPGKNSGAHYIQLGKRKSSEINVVNVASFIEIDPANQTVKNAIIALGSVAATPIRSFHAEEALKNSAANEAAFYEAGEAARRQDCKPIDDFRGTADYRRAMIGVLTKRTLEKACKQATAQ
ncbi:MULTISPECIES: FAD binding domain-containing protein [Desulfobacula]|uniref:HcrB: predicted 4-hydroxybenzoyl-CoA reductase, beta subunit n=2 Tax=Desulfobacula TaxID=28222 RepID=K0NF27_DESTT|nr:MULTISPECIES: xanthine dehydrogenase family protein subunit M [Desulfobacula]CCK79746.1 HcrB: predicted 4-hydroxybenzoyl-CoA reductase, beta subunit [Desulfobacula toluolica Tol2]SDU59685.1 carbon-monoxide dehydrogenase medium subunit [Desulfobacula phenolica]